MAALQLNMILGLIPLTLVSSLLFEYLVTRFDTSVANIDVIRTGNQLLYLFYASVTE